MAKTRKKSETTNQEVEQLERDYAKLMERARPAIRRPPVYLENLEQPSHLRFVDSFTTYGAYEEPI